MKVGNLLVDEIHEDLHFNYSLMCTVSIYKIVGLSGTFFNKDKFIQKVQNTMFPKEAIYDYLVSDPYITYVEATYYTTTPTEIKYSYYNQPTYNHIALEKWIMKNPRRLANYLALLGILVSQSYLNRAVDQQKILIYAASVEMVSYIRDYLEELVPPNMKVIAFTAGSEYDVILDHHCISATPGKASTAVDIPDLITVVSTYMTASLQKVVQMLGRLRRHTAPTLYVQLLCGDIEKQVGYQYDNRLVIDSRVKDYRQITLKPRLGGF